MTALPIAEPGVYDIDEAAYHADPVEGGSLSSSGVRRLLECPAKFDYERRNPRPPSRVFDLGHATHSLILGKGAPLVVIDAPDYRTKAAQALQQEAHEQGRTPVLRREHDQVLAMAAAIKDHPLAAALLSPKRGESEMTLIAKDPETGVTMRARPDKLPFAGKRRMVMPDLKSAHSVHPDALTKAAWDHGYCVQAPYYLRAARLLDLCGDDAAFLFVFVEKTPPHLIAVVELDELAMNVGRLRMRNALTRYATCKAEDNWPGYDAEGDGIQRIGLPPHVARRYEKETWL